jgi:ribosomal protein S2
MAEIINLRMARKAQKRISAEKTAAQNRAKFGITKAEKQKQRAEAERLQKTTDGARLIADLPDAT